MGHVLGRIIIQAENEEDAFDQVDDALMTITHEGGDYDSGSTLRESEAYMRNDTEQPIFEVCNELGSAKCDKCKSRFKCYTRKTVVLQVEIDKMKTNFFNHLEELRQIMASKTDEELFNDASFRYACNDCGTVGGSSLFDSDGSYIVNSKELEDSLKPREGMKVYVVTVDLHY